ncbi:MAG: PKD domain-containing protein, partial [Flavobacteriales bacterium]|nr:PKD domain-containing protein [Flavobacteriales bacterium]
YTPVAVGTDELVACQTTANCQRCDTVRITVLPLPVVDAGTDFHVCVDGNPAPLVGNPVGGTWSGTGVTGGGPYAFDPAVAGVGGPYQLIYSWTDANGCMNSDVIDATVDPLPVANAGPDATLCNEPTPYPLGGTPTPGNWTFVSQNTTATLNGGQYTPNGTGTDILEYTYMDAFGCEASDQVSITVVDPVMPDAGADQTVCLNTPPMQLVANPATATWSAAPGSSGTITSAGVYTPVAVGTDELVACQTTANCQRCDTVRITVLPLPVVDAGADFHVCVDGMPAPLAGNPAGGDWSGTGVTGGGPYSFDPGLAGVGGPYQLIYSWTDANGCMNSDVIDATVDPLPVANAGPDQILCDEPVPFVFAPIPGPGSWAFLSQSTNAGLTNADYTPNGYGTDVLVFTYMDASGCTDTDTLQIEVVTPVMPDAGPDDSLCVNAGPQQFVANPPGTWHLLPGALGTITSTGLYTPMAVGYDLLVNCLTTANCERCDTMQLHVLPLPMVDAGPDYSICQDAPVQQLQAMPAGGAWDLPYIFDPDTLAPGPNMWCYSYTEAATGCTNTDCIVVNVDSVPVPLFSMPDTACVNANVQFNNLTTCLCSYAWTFGDGGSSTDPDPLHMYLSVGTFPVTLIATSGSGCTDTLIMSITIIEAPTVGYTFGPASGCGPLLVNLVNNSQGVPISYAWDIDTFGASSQAQPGPVLFPPPPCDSIYYGITLTAYNQCGGGTQADSVLVFAPPQPAFLTNTNTICSPDSILFQNTTTCAWNTTYAWTFGDATGSNSQSTHLGHLYTTDSLIVQYVAMLTATNQCGTASTSDTITVLPNTVEAFFNANPLVGCPPLPVQFIQSTVGITQWTWEFGDGGQSTMLDPIHTYLSPGTYQIVFFATNGCASDTIVQEVEVLPLPLFDFSAMPDSVCVDESISFQPSGNNISGLTWNFGDGSGSNQTAPTHAFATPGTYGVGLTVTSTLNGCIDTVLHNVEVLTTPVAAFTLTPSDGCAPLWVELNETSIDGGYASWDLGDGNTSSGGTLMHLYDSAGTYLIRLTALNLTGCTDSTTATVVVHPIPTAVFDYAITTTPEPVLPVQFENGSTGAVAYVWQFGDGSGSTYLDPFHIYHTEEDCSFSPTLVATNEFLCRDTVVHVITVPRDLRIWAPNSFTPDGNGLNDEFVIQGADLVPSSVHLSIFDRWGALIHEVKGRTPSWDGTIGGQPCPNGVYVWKLKARLQCGYEEEEHVGHVTLLR